MIDKRKLMDLDSMQRRGQGVGYVVVGVVYPIALWVIVLTILIKSFK